MHLFLFLQNSVHLKCTAAVCRNRRQCNVSLGHGKCKEKRCLKVSFSYFIATPLRFPIAYQDVLFFCLSAHLLIGDISWCLMRTGKEYTELVLGFEQNLRAFYHLAHAVIGFAKTSSLEKLFAENLRVGIFPISLCVFDC